ncbi:MAG: nuclear transport factor 2 family protein [Verrucomicrobiota bacterium]|nr:nuclear transport factor 2 family protein [Verrucomicrobiota bacterium]MDQ6940106.1 nuclear transport factor 2 family protein [Verrucomicrobiota bacterium]
MKKLTSYVAVALLATISLAIASPDADAITAKEKAAWQAFKDKKADDFQKVVSNDVVAVYSQGMMNMAAEIEAMNKTTMKSFALSDIKVSMPDADTAICSYKAKVESTYDGKDNSGDYNCGSVWRKSGGEWKAVYHSDMKADK